jgi:sarcosine oxidase
MAGYDVAVIGAGVFGSWTAWRLRQAGQSVLLLDAWGGGHSRASSGGESRIIRMGYGADEIYTRMAMRSLEQWKALVERTGEPLLHMTGVLWIGQEGDQYSEATRQTLARAGVRIEIASRAALAERYPQMQAPGPNAFGIFEPEGGALLARRAVSAVVRDAIRCGVDYRIAAIDPESLRPGAGVLRTLAGEAVRADVFVFACGPWLPKLFPDLLGNRIRITRQEVFFFAPPAGDLRFTPPHLPVWIDFTHPRRPYGFPDLEGRGCKLAFDEYGPPFDPDSADRRIADEAVAEARRFLGERFPDLRGAPLTESRICQYENTASGDFLIDRHPDWGKAWLVGGGSGHGFKHGPAVGEYVTRCLTGGGPREPRFSLASKSDTEQRTVH